MSHPQTGLCVPIHPDLYKPRGMRLAGSPAPHGGLDLWVPEGVAVFAPGPGMVTQVGDHSVVIDHANGWHSRVANIDPAQLQATVLGQTVIGATTGKPLHVEVARGERRRAVHARRYLAFDPYELRRRGAPPRPRGSRAMENIEDEEFDRAATRAPSWAVPLIREAKEDDDQLILSEARSFGMGILGGVLSTYLYDRWRQGSRNGGMPW